MIKILNVPNKQLNQKAENVGQVDGRIRKLLKEMEKVLVAQDDPPGVGLAAPQVGANLRLFIIKPRPTAKTEIFINPKVLEMDPKIADKRPASAGDVAKKSKQSKLEGCLSIPRIWAPVKRQKTVKLSYLNETGEEKTATFSGFKATIIQHEVDHLNGILFTQRALEQNSQIYEESKTGRLKKIDY